MKKMSRSNLLDEVSTKIFVFIWLNGPIICTKSSLAKKLNLTECLINDALKKLHTRRWIRKNRHGKGVRIEAVKNEVPKYILEKADKYIDILAS